MMNLFLACLQIPDTFSWIAVLSALPKLQRMAAHAAWKAGLHYFEHMVKPAVNQQVSQVRSSLIWTMVSENNDFIEENQPESGGRRGWKRIWICSCIKQLWKFSLLYFLLLCSPCCSEDNAGNEHDPSQSINKYIFICVILCAAVALNAALVQAKCVKKKKNSNPSLKMLASAVMTAHYPCTSVKIGFWVRTATCHHH